MTDAELIAYYANLLVIQYISLPKAYATVQMVVSMVIMNQLPLAVQNAFNMDGSAVGVQLDVLGKYTGVTRTGSGLQGQPITLDDTDFFTLIKAAILTNNAQSDLNTIQTIINDFFPGELFVFDHKEMRMSYFINSSVGSQNLVELFITEGLLPKPMGVQLAAPIYTNNLKFFGFVNSVDVAAYAAQNSLTINQAALDIYTANNIWPFIDARSPITTQWLNSELGVSI